SKALESVSTELPAVTTTLKGIEAALSNLDIKALHETVATTKADIDGLTIKAAALSKRVSLLHEEEAAIRGSIASLTNLPLGNPTRMLRGVDPEDESVVTHEQLRRIGNGGKPSASAIGLTLDEALSQTTLVKGADDMNTASGPLVSARKVVAPNSASGRRPTRCLKPYSPIATARRHASLRSRAPNKDEL